MQSQADSLLCPPKSSWTCLLLDAGALSTFTQKNPNKFAQLELQAKSTISLNASDMTQTQVAG